MSEKRDTHTEEQQTKWRSWRPTRRPTWSQVLCAVGVVGALVVIAVLVDQLYPGIWQHVSDQPLGMLKGRVPTVIGIGAALTVIIALLGIGGASLGWTGFSERKLWDWLQLLSALAIPIVLAIAGYWFTMQQEARQQAIEDQRAQSAQLLENQRADQAALQAYVDQIGSLLFNRGLRTSKEDGNVRMLARARTLTMLDMLSPPRKARALEFLVEMKLIQADSPDQEPPPDQKPIISLKFADLHEVDMVNRDLLKSTDLDRANLNRADLTDANLSNANLSKAHLFRTNLRRTVLSNANLSGAYLRNADLTGADLTDANLSNANFRKAEGVSCQQTEQAESLEGATMPNGQKYEEWLKSKGCEEVGEDSGPS
jgi:hypothetical protein